LARSIIAMLSYSEPTYAEIQSLLEQLLQAFKDVQGEAEWIPA
jgi:hypothetical protein